MAHVGEAIANPATGEWIEFRSTAGTSGGRLLQFEMLLAPYGRVGGVPHRHEAAERFTVQSGTLSCRLGAARRELGPGESVDVPPNVSHYVFNDRGEPVRATVAIRPAGSLEMFFETVFAIAGRRRFKAFRGLPPPLQMALFADVYGVYAPFVPVALQRPAVRALAGVARRRGYAAVLPAPPSTSPAGIGIAIA